MRSLRWRLYVIRLRAPLGFASSLTMGLAPGKTGQVVKVVFMRRASGTPYRESVPATFAERVSDTVSVALLLVVGLALAPGVDLRAPAVVLVALLVALWLARREETARWLGAAMRRVRMLARHEPAMREGHARLASHLDARELLWPSVIGLAALLLEALALDALAGGALGVGSAAVVIALADLAGLASLVPGGVGATEGSMVALLALRGLALPEAAAATLLFRACTLWLGLALAGAAAGALHLRHASPAKG